MRNPHCEQAVYSWVEFQVNDDFSKIRLYSLGIFSASLHVNEIGNRKVETRANSLAEFYFLEHYLCRVLFSKLTINTSVDFFGSKS